MCLRFQFCTHQRVCILYFLKKKSNSLYPTPHMVANCQHTLRIRQHFASEHCAYSSKLIAHTAHAVALCQRLQKQIASICFAICKCMLRIRQQFASVHCLYGNKSSNILCFASVCCDAVAYAAHAVAHCQRMLRMRQQFSSVDGACGSKNKMARISPICKKCKIFISSLKSPTYRNFVIKKSLKSKRSKSHTWAPFRFCKVLATLDISEM